MGAGSDTKGHSFRSSRSSTASWGQRRRLKRGVRATGRTAWSPLHRVCSWAKILADRSYHLCLQPLGDPGLWAPNFLRTLLLLSSSGTQKCGPPDPWEPRILSSLPLRYPGVSACRVHGDTGAKVTGLQAGGGARTPHRRQEARSLAWSFVLLLILVPRMGRDWHGEDKGGPRGLSGGQERIEGDRGGDQQVERK